MDGFSDESSPKKTIQKPKATVSSLNCPHPWVCNSSKSQSHKTSRGGSVLNASIGQEAVPGEDPHASKGICVSILRFKKRMQSHVDFVGPNHSRVLILEHLNLDLFSNTLGNLRALLLAKTIEKDGEQVDVIQAFWLHLTAPFDTGPRQIHDESFMNL